MAAPERAWWEPRHSCAAGRYQGLSAHTPLHEGQEQKGNNRLPEDLVQSYRCQSRTNSFKGPGDLDYNSGEPQRNNHRVGPLVSNSVPVAPIRFKTR